MFEQAEALAFGKKRAAKKRPASEALRPSPNYIGEGITGVRSWRLPPPSPAMAPAPAPVPVRPSPAPIAGRVAPAPAAPTPVTVGTPVVVAVPVAMMPVPVPVTMMVPIPVVMMVAVPIAMMMPVPIPDRCDIVCFCLHRRRQRGDGGSIRRSVRSHGKHRGYHESQCSP